MYRLICAFVVCIQHKTHFLMARLMWIAYFVFRFAEYLSLQKDKYVYVRCASLVCILAAAIISSIFFFFFIERQELQKKVLSPYNWAASWQNPIEWSVCSAKTETSLGIRPVWSASLQCTQWVAEDPMFLHADSKDWSDWVDAKADLSLLGAHAILLVLSWGSSYILICSPILLPCVEDFFPIKRSIIRSTSTTST